MASTVGLLITSAVVKIAGEKLGSAMAEQASLLWSFSDDLRYMKETLETIEAVLKDAEKRSIKEMQLRLWLKRLKNAALDICDMLDEHPDTDTQATAKKPGVLSSLPKKIVVANKMKKMRKELRNINDQHRDFKLIKSTSDDISDQPCDHREPSSSNVDREKIIGRDIEKNRIIQLLSASERKEDLRIVPIYGLGGVGKTTLAGLVYNDNQIINKYDHRVWVYVSQVCDIEKIGRSIISQLRKEAVPHNTDIQLINQGLEDILPNKKILIVLDDLWEENDFKLEKLMNMLKKGSMIDVIATTRKKDIAMKICAKEQYKLEPLHHDICWKIIKIFSQLEDINEHFEPIGQEIAKKCAGLPLAAQALGYMLKSKDLKRWSEVNDSDIWNESSEDEYAPQRTVLPSLKLSFESMSSQLRLCFSYCAIFPKGCDIIHTDLIHQWIALGIFKPSSRLGEEYINQLLGMSFLQHSKLPSSSREHATRYKMHDRVHDLARSVMGDELSEFHVATKSSTSEQNYCRYALLVNYDKTEKLSNILPQKVWVLRFELLDSSKLDLPDGAFSFAKYLRILDFSACYSVLLPVSIGQLRQLRCLIAPRTQNVRLPECITELSKLQYLNLNGSSQISALPESIGKLGCLMHLDLSGCSCISKLSESFSDLKSLMHLDMSGCSGITELPGSLGNLTSLQHLELSDCEGLKALPESFCGLKRLQHLDISSCRYLQRLPNAIGSLADLQYLSMSKCNCITELPESFQLLQSLVHLDMSSCSKITELPASLGKLKSLEHLELSHCEGLKALPESICGLKRLQYLDISSCLCLQRLPNAIGSLADLQYLNMSRCNLITELPGSFQLLRSLVHLDMSSCSKITELPGSLGNLTSLQRLELTGCKELKALPESLYGLRRLHYLNLSFCSDLQRLPVAIGTLTDLQYLNMKYCCSITELPESFQFLKNLEHLDLSSTLNMRRLPGALRGLTSLQYLDMSYNMYGIGGGLSEALRSLTNLRYLNLKYAIDGGFHKFIQARHTYLDFIGALTSLEHLDLSSNSTIAYLPESVGNLKRLHTLDLSYCTTLKSLPKSLGAITLRYILMEGCSYKLVDQAKSLLHNSLVLPRFNVRTDDVSAGSNLQKLKGLDTSELKILSLENVRSLDEAYSVKLLDKQSLSGLKLAWTLGTDRFLEDKDLLGQLVPPRGLKYLTLEGYISASFPTWLMDISHYLPNLVDIILKSLPRCCNLPPLGQLPNLRSLLLADLPSITKIDRDLFGGNGAFPQLSWLRIWRMEGLEEWNTTYHGEHGVEEFMFPKLDTLEIQGCPRLRMKPCPPMFRECEIEESDQVISSLEELDNSSHVSSTQSTKLVIRGSKSQSLRLFHHFPALQQLKIHDLPNLTSWPEGMRHLTSLQSLELYYCNGISALPEWLGELSSLRSLTIAGCRSIKSLPPCIQQLTKLQKLHIKYNRELKQWCESNENGKMLAHISDKLFMRVVISLSKHNKTLPTRENVR
ncbi:hypothetical protein ACP4OV_027947 [Aristida adscensionis]